MGYRLPHLAHLAAYNRWMNEKFFSAAGQLGSEVLHGDMKAFGSGSSLVLG